MTPIYLISRVRLIHTFAAIALLVVVLTIGGGCKRGAFGNRAQGDTPRELAYTTNDLSRLITNGLPIDLATNLLGTPYDVSKEGDGVTVFIYFFHGIPPSQDYNFIGCVVSSKDGKVGSVSAILESKPQKMFTQTRETFIGEEEIHFLFATGSSDLLPGNNGSNAVSSSSQSFSRTDFVFRAAISIGSGGVRGGETEISLGLKNKDSQAIARLTEENVGSQMQVVWRGKTIARPMIFTTISSSRMVLKVKKADLPTDYQGR